MKQKPLSPPSAELRQTHAVMVFAVAVPGLLLTATGVLLLVKSRMASDIVLGILTVAFGRIQARARRLQPAPQLVEEAVETALRDFEALRLGGEAHVVREVPAGLWVTSDRQALGQVLVNLLSNAFKYGGPSKRIWVRAAAERKRVTITVEDEGPGVPPAMRRRIFREFVRGEDPEITAKPGTRLGLAIAQR